MTIVYGILGLGFLVFFHELGHFLAARLFGVKVEAFSIGMGPVLLHRGYKGTDYRISLIPLGGYCAMKGENDWRTALEENKSVIEGEKDSFYGIHPLKRLLIAFAGPFFNFVFVFIAFFVIALIGYKYYDAGTTVKMADEVYENISSPAHEAGMRSGDTIIALDGNKVEYYAEIFEYIALNADKDIAITFLRDGNTMELTVHSVLDKDTGAGKIGIAPTEFNKERKYGPYPFFAAAGQGVYKTFNELYVTVKSIGVLFSGVKITKVVAGPVRMTTMIGGAVKAGFKEGLGFGVVSTLEFLALISISLFITNLLPIPILDGGLILFAFIECVFRRKMHPKVLYYIQFIGIAFIALLLVIAIASDFRYFIGKEGKL
ncbi:MAG: site-2 protease family protein [Treponema sp.]|nr:site-2 protease family protein [Treponema sp.]